MTAGARGTARVARIAALVAGVLGLAGVGFGLVERPGGLRAGANEFVNDRSGAGAPEAGAGAAVEPGEAHNSPTVAVDPRQPSTIAVANRVDAPDLGCAVSVSTNAGASWAPLARTPGLAAVNCFWPRVAYLPDGTLLVLYTPLGGPNVLPLSVQLQRYRDGRPDGGPLAVAPELAFHARMAVAGERVWLSWVQAGPATIDNQLGLVPGVNPVVVSRSSDGGRTFSAPVRVSEPDRRVIQPTLLAPVTADGRRVVVGALDLNDDLADYQASHDGQTPPDPRLRWRVVAWTSEDGGATFGPTAVVAAEILVPQLIIADLGPTPGFAQDARTGRVYATWDGGRGDARDCFLAWSDDGGRTWSAPVRVGPTKGSQVLPAVAVAPDGRVDVLFYDRSRDGADRLQEAVVATSRDGGRTFRWAAVSDGATDSRVGLGAQQGVPLQGDNLALLSRADDVLAFWADTSRGSETAIVEDLAVATVTLDGGGGRRPAFIAVGATLLFAAALLVLARQSG